MPALKPRWDRRRQAARRLRFAGFALFAFFLPLGAGAQAQDFRLSLVEPAAGDPICTARFAVENRSGATLLGLNGAVELIGPNGPIGVSRGLLVGPIGAGASLVAELQAANLPCGEITSYVFVVESCQTEAGFLDRRACAAAFEPVPPFTSVIVR